MITECFEKYMRDNGIEGLNALTTEDVSRFITKIRDQDESIKETLKALAKHAMDEGCETLRSETVLLFDAPDVMNKLSEVTRETLGEEVWERVFGGVDMPKIGDTLDEMSGFTRDMEKRFLNAAKREDYECACEAVAHCWTPAWDPDGRARFLEIRSIDALCDEYNDSLIQSLEKCAKEGRLFFTQDVDDEVIEYVKANPQFYRIGSKIYVKRMPYLTKRYLEETDPVKKRYYACHCPWGRNSILQAEKTISRSFCHCSLGLVKKGFEVAFDCKLHGETAESVLDGDGLLCVFAIDIPEDILLQYT